MQTQVTRLIQTSGSRPNLPEFLGVELARDNFCEMTTTEYD